MSPFVTFSAKLLSLLAQGWQLLFLAGKKDLTLRQQRNRRAKMKSITMKIGPETAPWIWRMAMLFLTCGIYYLHTYYVTRIEWRDQQQALQQEYYADKHVWWTRLSQISTSLHSMDLSMQLLEINRAAIADHEKRIRDLELRQRQQP